MRHLLYLMLVWWGFFPASFASQQVVYGYLEKVMLLDGPLALEAKMDTGAKSASLYATNIQKVMVKGKRYLEFTVPTANREVRFRQPLVGYVRIKTRAGENNVGLVASAYRRPVVKMAVKLGNDVRSIRINLADRGNFNYSLLMGRDAIVQFNGLVDPSQTFILRGS